MTPHQCRKDPISFQQRKTIVKTVTARARTVTATCSSGFSVSELTRPSLPNPSVVRWFLSDDDEYDNAACDDQIC